MTIPDFREGETSIFIKDKMVDLEIPILDILELDEIFLVLVEDFDLSPDDPNVGRNIIALDKSGNVVWRVQPFWHTVRAEDGRKVPDSYRSLRLEEGNKIYSYQGIGYVCEIDPQTGKIIGEEYTR